MIQMAVFVIVLDVLLWALGAILCHNDPTW